MKDRTQKTADEMDIHEFTAWASGFMLFAIGEGRTLQSAMTAIVQSAACNHVFGGQKKDKK